MVFSARGLVRRTGPTSIRNYRQHHRQKKRSLVEKLPPNHRLTEIQTTDKWQFGRRMYQCFCPKGTLVTQIFTKKPFNGQLERCQQVSTHVRRIRRTTCSKSNATPPPSHQRGGTAEPRHALRTGRQRTRSLRFIMGFPDDALARCSCSHCRRACARIGQPPSSARAPTSPQRRADADRDATPRSRTRSRRVPRITDSTL